MYPQNNEKNDNWIKCIHKFLKMWKFLKMTSQNFWKTEHFEKYTDKITKKSENFEKRTEKFFKNVIFSIPVLTKLSKTKNFDKCTYRIIKKMIIWKKVFINFSKMWKFPETTRQNFRKTKSLNKYTGKIFGIDEISNYLLTNYLKKERSSKIVPTKLPKTWKFRKIYG